ncbi:MAG: ribose-5-phosphate isomerase A, partial [Candidatus Latescibacterota bacterium]|nr:ribose-5-phosphate isomerase A [Candidatus Latescibacterota bacterium]
TDNGNFILDCGFPDGIHDPAQLDADINRMPSVVENGLFVGLAHIVIVAEIGADDCRIMERS